MEIKELVKKAVSTATNGKTDDSEGKVAREIVNESSKLPSNLFLWVGLACLGASLVASVFDLKKVSQVIGKFASPILIMGLYNKLVKVQRKTNEPSKTELEKLIATDLEKTSGIKI